ncbi:MAG: anti-sigma factor [Actinomycetota bacterium]|nr:anti-sigma factor [Actinomycetota bacterium]
MSDELNVLAGAYALDALDEDERILFEQHLEECDECTEEVRGMRCAASELSRTTEVSPPPQLRADVLASISQVRPLAPVVDNVIALHRARAARSVWQVMAAACAIIAIVAAGWGFSQHRTTSRTSAAQVSAVQKLLAAPDLRASTTAFEKGSGTLVYSKDEHKLVLIGHGMPALASDKTYQLWMLPTTGDAISAGTFTPDSAGNVELPAAGDLTGIPKMGISVEPAGGSAQPTAGTVQLLNL